jgi:hypothetical protein
MSRIVFAVFMCIVVVSACSQSEKASTPAPSPTSVGTSAPSSGPAPSPTSVGSSAPTSSNGAAPVILSAALSPERPTAATKIYAHYTVRNPGSSGIKLVFRWFVNNAPVQETSVAELDPGNHVRGSEVYAEIVPSNEFGAGKPVQTNVLTVDNLPPVVSSISLTPSDPPVGVTIKATASAEDVDGDMVALTYQWYVNGKPLTDAQKSNEFSTTGLHKKDLLFAVVEPSDGTVVGTDRESDIMVIANSAPQITSTPKYVVQDGLYQYQVSAKDPDGDTVTYGLLTSPPGMTIDSSTGLIAWNVPASIPEKQEIAVKLSADDGDGGTVHQAFSFFLLPN